MSKTEAEVIANKLTHIPGVKEVLTSCANEWSRDYRGRMVKTQTKNKGLDYQVEVVIDSGLFLNYLRGV